MSKDTREEEQVLKMQDQLQQLEDHTSIFVCFVGYQLIYSGGSVFRRQSTCNKEVRNKLRHGKVNTTLGGIQCFEDFDGAGEKHVVIADIHVVN